MWIFPFGRAILPFSTVKKIYKAAIPCNHRGLRLFFFSECVVCESYFKNFFIFAFSSFGL